MGQDGHCLGEDLAESGLKQLLSLEKGALVVKDAKEGEGHPGRAGQAFTAPWGVGGRVVPNPHWLVPEASPALQDAGDLGALRVV